MAHLDDRLGAIAIRGRFAPDLLQRFKTWVETASDGDLFRVNPVAFAAGFGITENQAIDLFVHASHAGIFDLTWGKLCELCGAYLTRPEGIRATGEALPCAPCETLVVGTQDDAVEVTFTVSGSIRHIRYHDDDVRNMDDFFRIFVAPSAKPSKEFRDYIEQWWFQPITVPPNSTVTTDAQLVEGRYTFFTFDAHVASKIIVKPGAPGRAEIDVFDGQIVPAQLTLGPGRATLVIRNRTKRRVVVSAERVPGDDDLNSEEPLFTRVPCLTGKRLLSNQSFRDLFSGAMLGEQMLQIKNMAFLFTDLRASTALYARIGDLKAHTMVQEHFQVLGELVDRHGGAVVKTIGDAVMATFAEPRVALAAALAMNPALAKLRRRDLSLKVGVHAGECLAVDSNDRLDYFGQTVNIAARVQALADGGEVVCTESIWGQPGADDMAVSAKMRPKTEKVRLKGVDGVMRVTRLVPGGSAPKQKASRTLARKVSRARAARR